MTTDVDGRASFLKAELEASDADVANITTEWGEIEERTPNTGPDRPLLVKFDLLDRSDLPLVRKLVSEHRFDLVDETGERLVAEGY